MVILDMYSISFLCRELIDLLNYIFKMLNNKIKVDNRTIATIFLFINIFISQLKKEGK